MCWQLHPTCARCPGMVWALITPLLMLAIYTFVFSVVFKAKWGAYLPDQENTISFAVLLYSGLIVHQFLAEVLGRSTNIILEHANFVKKVVFPLELLPFMIIHTALFMFMIQLSVLFAVMAFLGHTFHLTIDQTLTTLQTDFVITTDPGLR